MYGAFSVLCSDCIEARDTYRSSRSCMRTSPSLLVLLIVLAYGPVSHINILRTNLLIADVELQVWDVGAWRLELGGSMMLLMRLRCGEISGIDGFLSYEVWALLLVGFWATYGVVRVPGKSAGKTCQGSPLPWRFLSSRLPGRLKGI